MVTTPTSLQVALEFIGVFVFALSGGLVGCALVSTSSGSSSWPG